MPADTDAIPMLPGLSSIQVQTIEARCDTALMSSDSGLLALPKIGRRTGLAARLADCIADPSAP